MVSKTSRAAQPLFFLWKSMLQANFNTHYPLLLALGHRSRLTRCRCSGSSCTQQKKLSQTQKCSHARSKPRKAKPWEYWHSDKSGTRRDKPTAHKRVTFLHTIVALTYTFRKRIFLAWDEFKKGAKKTTSILMTEKTDKQPCVYLMSLNTDSSK